MAEEKFKVNETGVDTNAVASAIKDSAPSVHSEFNDQLDADVAPPSYRRAVQDVPSANDYTSFTNAAQEKRRQAANNRSSSGLSKSSDLDRREELGNNETSESEDRVVQSAPISSSGPSHGPAYSEPGPRSGGIPSERGIEDGDSSSSLGTQGNNAGLPNGQSNLGTGANNASLGKNNGGLEDEGQGENSPQDQKKAERQRENENNANNIRNVADAAMASPHPIPKAIGAGVKAADKITGGKSTELLGRAMTTANRLSPGGRRIQNASNKLSESGASDKIGQAAAAKNGQGASKAGETAKKASDAKKKADTAKKGSNPKKPDPKRAKSNKEAGAADGDANRSESGKANMDGITRAIAGFFIRHPFVLISTIVIILLFFLLITSGDFKGGSNSYGSYTKIDYGDYELSSEGDTILNERLDKFLESKGSSLEEFNQLIESNVQKNGYGTRAGVVTAAVTLIAELGNKYNVKVPYFLSGGHHDGVRKGALGYWGSGTEDDGRRCYYTGYGNVYTVCGLDCSGFVPWAIKNGGFQVGVRLAGDFQAMDGAKRVSLSSSSAVLEPGDLLESEGHIVLVVGIDESSSQYICAEASGKNSGVLFTRRPFTGGSGYWGVKMDGYYDKYSLAGK